MGPKPSDNVGEWFGTHQGDLERLARRLTGVGAAAEDALQETWRIALERPPERTDGIAGWLGRVLRNVVFGRRRDERTRLRLRTPEVEAFDESPAAALERFETARVIARAVDDLAEPFKTAVVLRYFEGLEPDAIAKKLGVPASTVRSRLARGLAGLRDTLQMRFGGDATRRSSSLALSAGLAFSRTGDAGKLITILLRSLLVASKTKIAVAALLLVCAVPMAFYVWHADDEVSLDRSDVAVDADHDTGPRRAVAAEGASKELPESAVPETRNAATVAESARLHLDLNSETGFGKEPLLLTVADPAHPESAMKKTFDAVGAAVETDISPLLRNGTPPLLSVTIDHPLHMPETLVIDTARQNRKAEDGTRRFDVSATLAPASAFAGRVENRSGSPADVKVGIYVRDAAPKGVMGFFFGRTDGRRSAAVTSCADDGSFFLRVPKTDTATIIAAGRSLLPAHWSGQAQALAVTDVGTLIVEAGVDVAGTVRAGQVPLGRARIKIAARSAEGKVEGRGEGLRLVLGGQNESDPPKNEGRSFTIGSSSDDEAFRLDDTSYKLDATSGRLRKSVDTIVCDVDGKFTIGGLRPGGYRLTLDGFENDVNEMFAVADKLKRTDVVAPAVGIDFSVDAGFLTFTAVDPADPNGEFEGRIVDAEHGEWRGKRSVADRRAVLVASGRAIEAAIEKAGFHDWTCKITSPAAGVTTVITAELEKDASAKDLVIRIPGAAKNGGKKLFIKFESIPIPGGKNEDGETWFETPPLPQSAQGTFVAEVREGDEFRFRALRIPLGRYRLLGRMNVPFTTWKDRTETIQLFRQIDAGSGEDGGEMVLSFNLGDGAPPQEDIENRRAVHAQDLPGTDFTEAESEIDWIDAKTIEGTLPIIYGGRFSVVVHSDDGLLREANLTIRTPGKTIVSTDGYAGRNTGRGRSGSTLTDEPILPYLGLPPGTYFVTAATKDFPETTAEVSIKAGEVTPLDIVLLPK